MLPWITIQNKKIWQMEIKYSKKFLKDLAKIDNDYREKIEELVFFDFVNKNPYDLKMLEKMKGYKNKYKVRVGSYRIGITISDDCLYFERVLPRSKIYQIFP
jgi:mRNA interferase RelE/StbE